MSVTLRIVVLVLFVKHCFSTNARVFPGSINDFALYNPNLFVVTPPSADQVVALALVEEVPAEPDGEKKSATNNENVEESDEIDKQKIVKQTDKNIDRAEKAVESRFKNRAIESEKSQEDKDHDKIEQAKKLYKGKKGHKSAKFGEKQGHKKGHKTKGYNNRFHKDEYHKEHKLYGDAYRDNSKNLYKDVHSKHAKKDDGYRKLNHKVHNHKNHNFGKKDDVDEGKFDDRDEDFDKKSGHAAKNIHHVSRLKIKDEVNPYPNHRPY